MVCRLECFLEVLAELKADFYLHLLVMSYFLQPAVSALQDLFSLRLWVSFRMHHIVSAAVAAR